jgi:hypothetical protein
MKCEIIFLAPQTGDQQYEMYKTDTRLSQYAVITEVNATIDSSFAYDCGQVCSNTPPCHSFAFNSVCYNCPTIFLQQIRQLDTVKRISSTTIIHLPDIRGSMQHLVMTSMSVVMRVLWVSLDQRVTFVRFIYNNKCAHTHFSRHTNHGNIQFDNRNCGNEQSCSWTKTVRIVFINFMFTIFLQKRDIQYNRMCTSMYRTSAVCTICN